MSFQQVVLGTSEYPHAKEDYVTPNTNKFISSKWITDLKAKQK